METPRDTVVVESVEPRHTSDDVARKVKSELDIIGMSIRVNSLGGQKVIRCDTASNQKVLRDAMACLEIGFTATSQLPEIHY